MLSFINFVSATSLVAVLSISPISTSYANQQQNIEIPKSQHLISLSHVSPTAERDTVKTAVVAYTGAMVIPADVAGQSDIIATAMQFIGVPYVAYAASPENGFDCSGFIMYVYGLHGISLPHSATQQAAMGHEISEAEARPGDLLFWGGHIAFWVAPGMMIDSAKEGTSVDFRPIWGTPQIIRLDV